MSVSHLLAVCSAVGTAAVPYSRTAVRPVQSYSRTAVAKFSDVQRESVPTAETFPTVPRDATAHSFIMVRAPDHLTPPVAPRRPPSPHHAAVPSRVGRARPPRPRAFVSGRVCLTEQRLLSIYRRHTVVAAAQRSPPATVTLRRSKSRRSVRPSTSSTPMAPVRWALTFQFFAAARLSLPNKAIPPFRPPNFCGRDGWPRVR
jgi:hypothetical protein